MPSVKVDDLLKETVNRARLMFSAAVGVTTTNYEFLISVRYTDRAGSTMLCANFWLPNVVEGRSLADTPSMEFSATLLNCDQPVKGAGLDEWAKFLNSKGWLASWVTV